jgi:site-specific recombinase XerD
MSTKNQDQAYITSMLHQIVAGTVHNTVSGFLIDRRSQGLSHNTLRIYTKELGYFLEFLDQQGVVLLEEVTPNVIRLYMLSLSEKRNPGGCRVAYRVIRTFTYWVEQESDGEYRSPVRKVKAPKVADQPLMPANLDDLKKMLDTCGKEFFGCRDRAIILCLLDSGCRASEFISVNLVDVDLISGAVLIRAGKGGKIRNVFVGQKAKRVLRSYLRQRNDTNPALWVNDEGERLTYWGLRQIIRRRAERAGVKEPPLHSFRRAFAINMLRAGMDIFSLQKLMGHADLQVLRRYLAQTTADIAQAYRMGSPVDRNKL